LRLLLDTTYLLPAIGITIKNLPKNILIELMRKNQIFISEASIFELSAKGANYIIKETLPIDRVIKGVKAIIYNEAISKIPIYEATVLTKAFKLKKFLSDFIDCLILSSAVNFCDALITEDAEIQNLTKNKEFNEFIASINSKFKIQKTPEI
jgi:PIN domain nuclease of toxin-antitoxin system